MADKKISALTASTTPLAGTEVLPIVQSGATVKVAVSDLTAGRAVSASGFTSTTNNLVISTAGKGVTTGSATALGFGVNNSTTDMVIDTNKNVRVGSASGFDSGVIAYPAAGASYLGVQHTTGTASGVSYVQFVYDSNQIATISQNGTTGVLYNITSDVRLKKNIANADNAANLIDALQVRKFDWKSDNSHQRYGFVAQELAEVAPEAVSQPADPDEMMGVDYSKLVPMLVKEIQSLRARVAQLEGK